MIWISGHGSFMGTMIFSFLILLFTSGQFWSRRAQRIREVRNAVFLVLLCVHCVLYASQQFIIFAACKNFEYTLSMEQ